MIYSKKQIKILWIMFPRIRQMENVLEVYLQQLLMEWGNWCLTL